MTKQTNSDKNKTPLGIVAGQGDLPQRIIDACKSTGRNVFVLGIKGETREDIIENVPHKWIRLGALGEAFTALREAGVKQIVMAGRIERPSIASLRPDAKAAKLLAKLGTKMFAGDDRLLSIIVDFLEEEGFEVVGADDILDDIVTPEGLIGKVYPDRQSQADIEIGAKIAKEIGRLDIGQAVIIQQGHILGVEAMEGTDKLIERCAEVKLSDRGGVLVKVKKPYQEKRVDLPTIGVHTVEQIAKAGFAGIAVEAGGSLIIDRQKVGKTADKYNVFVIGFTMQ